MLHEELDRLPEKYRAPIVLCYLESLTHDQAAQRLRWPVGTVRSRLARGREQLRRRLTRRGLALPVGPLDRAFSAETAIAAFPRALVGTTALAAVRFASGRLLTAGVTRAPVALLVKGAMTAMFMTKMKFAVLACGLITTGAVSVAQHVRSVPEAEARPLATGVTETRANPSAPLDESTAADIALGRELVQLDLDLLAEEVQQLREQVEVRFRDKFRAERRDSGGSDTTRDTQPKELKETQSAYNAARVSYLEKARELRSRQRGVTTARKPMPVGEERSKGSPSPAAARSGSHYSAPAIGSIDMDAVFKRYEKVQQSLERTKADIEAEQKRLANTAAQTEKLVRTLQDLPAGSGDFIALQARIDALKEVQSTERGRVQDEANRRQVRTTAALLEDVQETIASVAKENGLSYVVKVSPSPRTDSAPNEVQDALNRSVVYADPENDLTEDVIRELNRKFKAARAKTSR